MSHKDNSELAELAEDLFQFMKNELRFDRDPKIHFESSEDNANNILGKTGFYDPDSEEITVFITNRHPKDILRSLAHELIHHAQVCEGMMDPSNIAAAADENYILHDDHLKDLEEDAFGRGNLIFRKWEACKKMNNKEQLDEAKKKSKKSKKKGRKLTTKQYNKAKKMATSMEKKQGYSAEKAHKIAFAQVQKENIVAPLKESKNENNVSQPANTVEVNEALKDSLVYNKEDRSCNDLYNSREEVIFQEMLKKFGIKK